MRLHLSEGNSNYEQIDPQITIEEARDHTIRNIRLILNDRHEMPIQLQSKAAENLAASYSYAILQFIIGHELGHIFFHKNRKTFTGHWTRIDEEYFADLFSTDVCHGLVDTPDMRKVYKEDTAARILFEAPYICFPIVEIIEKECGLHASRTHPAAALRSDRLLRLQKKRGIDALFSDIAEERMRHMRTLAPL